MLRFAGTATLILTVIAFLAVGCTKEQAKKPAPIVESAPKENEIVEVKEQPSDPGEMIELTFATPAGHTVESFDLRFGDSIRKNFPQYVINYIPNSQISFENLVVTNTTVDLVYAAILDFGRGPLRYNMVHDMTELIKQHDLDLDRISIDWYDGLSHIWNNQIYGIPISLESLTLFYNEDLFEKFGVPYPQDELSWDDVFELNLRMTRAEDNVNYVGITFGLAQHFSLNGLSAPYIDPITEKAGLSTEPEKWRTIFETISIRPTEAQGYREKVQNLGRLPHQTEFLAEEAAMFAGLVHSPLTWADMEEINWNMVTYPTYPGAPNIGAQGNLLLVGITNTSPHKNEAMEVLKYLYSDEFQVDMSADGNIPVVINDETTSVFAQNTYYKDRNVQSVFKLDFAPLSKRTMYDQHVTSIYRSQIVQLANGEVDLNSMMHQIEQEANQAIEAEKK